MKLQLKKDKGTAGLAILLSVVVMLFIIGLLVMIFVIMGGKLRESTFTAVDGTATNESTGYFLNTTTYTVDYATVENFRTFNVTNLHNASDGEVILLGNITQGATGTIVNATNDWEGTYEVNVSYTYTWDTDNEGTSVIQNTTDAIATTSDWFEIFIVITAMVVLILLTVIIITAIRSSGLVDGMGSPSGANKVGTA